MLDKVQTWHSPHLYSIRIQKVYMSGHEISKQHIAFKQNAKSNSDVNIKQYQSILSSIQKEKKKKQNKKTNKQKQYIFLKTKVEILYLKTEHLQDINYFVPHMSLKKFTLPLLLFPQASQAANR